MLVAGAVDRYYYYYYYFRHWGDWSHQRLLLVVAGGRLGRAMVMAREVDNDLVVFLLLLVRGEEECRTGGGRGRRR